MKLFNKGDVDGFFALALDNMLMLILMSNFCLGFPLFLPPEIFFGRILPAATIGVVIGNLYYARQALLLAKREDRNDVCALPFGINIITLIAFIFLVLYPAKFIAEGNGLNAEEAAIFAWRAGILACFVAGLIEFFGSFVAEKIRKFTPRAALLAPVGGIGLCFLSMDFFFRAFAYPILGLVTLGVTLVFYFGRIKLKAGIPSGLVILLVGTGLAWFLHFTQGIDVVPVGSLDDAVLGFYLPIPVIADLVASFSLLPIFLPVILPIGCISVIISMQNIESAAAAGDNYPTLPSMLYNGASSIITGLCGSPFPTSIYIGHPGWKALGSRAGYSVLNAIFVSVLCLTGALTYVVYFIPVEAGMAILIWIGVAMASQAYEATPKRHIPAVVFGMMPVIAAFCALIIKKSLVSLGFGGPDNPFPPDLHETFVSSTDLFLAGIFSLEQGYIYSSMVIASATVYIIDQNFEKAALWFLIGAILSSIGFIHSFSIEQADVVGQIGLFFTSSSTIAYILLATITYLVPKFCEIDPEKTAV
jgi:AGZA family xanthine/uracil permease-like MFS transporter